MSSTILDPMLLPDAFFDRPPTGFPAPARFLTVKNHGWRPRRHFQASKTTPGNSGGIFCRQKSCRGTPASFLTVKNHVGRPRRHFQASKVTPGDSGGIFCRQKPCPASPSPFLTVKNRAGVPRTRFISTFCPDFTHFNDFSGSVCAAPERTNGKHPTKSEQQP
jgi:hypothetical protein